MKKPQSQRNQTTIAVAVAAALSALSTIDAKGNDTITLKAGPLSANVDIYDIQIDKTVPGVRHFGVTGETGYQEVTLAEFGDKVLVVTQQLGQEEKRKLLDIATAKALMLSFNAMFQGEIDQPTGAAVTAMTRHGLGKLHVVDLSPQRKAA